MTALPAVGLILLVITLTAVFRRPAHLAAVGGACAALVMIVAVPALAVTGAELRGALAAAGVIVLAAAAVILPGLHLNEQLTRRHVHDELVGWVHRLPLLTTHKAPLIVVGLAPALESLTGFGISLLVTVPLLLAITSRGTALRQAMLGMNVMPWGTLALATLIGAALAGQPLRAVAFGSALVSALVFPLFGAITAAMVANRGERAAPARVGAALGGTFTVALVTLNALGIVELAGVLAGAFTSAAGLLLLAKGRVVPRPPWVAVGPYVLLLALVAAVRAAALAGLPATEFAISGGAVQFHPLGSPGVALAAAVLVLDRGRLRAATARATVLRAYKPIVALSGFTLMAQLMVASGMIDALGTAVPSSRHVAVALVAPFVGMLSGYMTGSNVGGNALMMPAQAAVGLQLDRPVTLAAIQNSTAGHAVFASVPIVLLVLAIAGGGRAGEEPELVRYGLRVAAGVYVATTLIALALFATGVLDRP